MDAERTNEMRYNTPPTNFASTTNNMIIKTFSYFGKF